MSVFIKVLGLKETQNLILEFPPRPVGRKRKNWNTINAWYSLMEIALKQFELRPLH